MSELMRFKSHVNGKNADVAIFDDRVEWGKDGWMGNRGKAALGVATMGVSLLKTGVGGGKSRGTEVIPVKSITSVSTKKDGLRFTLVQVIASGNTIDFRVGHNDAAKIKGLLTDLITGKHPAATPPAPPEPAAPPPPPAPPAEGSLADKIKELAELRDAGVLSEEEFAAAKARLIQG